MKQKKQPEYLEDVEIVDAGSEGMSVAKPEGRVIFIPFGVPGDVVDIEVFKKKKNCSPSEFRENYHKTRIIV
jgi:23S rRNA (uracil1939-C5)-methyltransferase